MIGVMELAAAILIAIRPIAPRLSAIGSVLATFTFLATLSFLFSLPGWERSLGGFPALSGSGGFLLKDVVLLGAALFTLGDSLSSATRTAPQTTKLPRAGAVGLAKALEDVW